MKSLYQTETKNCHNPHTFKYVRFKIKEKHRHRGYCCNFVTKILR